MDGSWCPGTLAVGIHAAVEAVGRGAVAKGGLSTSHSGFDFPPFHYGKQNAHRRSDGRVTKRGLSSIRIPRVSVPGNVRIVHLLSRLEGVRKCGDGWSALCPAHEDRSPSLSISDADDGRVLVHCHAGCSVDAVCGAVGLRVADLMPDDLSTASTSTQSRETRGKRQYRRRDDGKPAGATYETANAAVAVLEQRHGKRSALWTYHDAHAEPFGLIVRWDKPKGKEIRPVARRGDRWIIGGMPEPRPLYRLPDLAGADRVYICEGEKAADSARSIGLTATTSAHGSQSPEQTDWSLLAGKQCVILPDHDDPGGKYADTVAAILAKLTPAAVVKVVDLPDLPDHGDIADWVEAQPAADVGELRRQVQVLVDQAEAIQPIRPAARMERFQPFPTDALPEPIRGFVVAGAKAIGCDPSYLALPLLTALAAAIGNTRRIQLKRGWSAPAIIWTAIVGESGTAKTPAFTLVMRPIRERQRMALELHAEAMSQYEADLAHYDKALSAWKRDKKTEEPPPAKPDPSQAARFIVSDTTVEALAPLLFANPRGVLMARDELAGWIGSFDRYAGGKGGADAAHWLSMHNGEAIVVDRKTGNPRMIYVPQALVSVTGGIQPAILHRALGIEHRESGLAARLLLTCPPRKPKLWTEADIAPDAEAELARLVSRLYDLQPTVDDEGNPRPVVVGLTRDAKADWKAYYNSHAREQVNLVGELSAAWSKLEEYAARLALVIHYIRWAADDADLENTDAVDAVSMKAGIELAQWFKAEARRVYAMLSESDDDRRQRQLIEWIERKSGSVTAREVQQGHRQYRTAQEAEAALEELAKAGCGQWQSTPPGRRGQPTRRFTLCTVSTVNDNTLKLEGNGNAVDVDSVDTPESQSDDEWGVL